MSELVPQVPEMLPRQTAGPLVRPCPIVTNLILQQLSGEFGETEAQGSRVSQLVGANVEKGAQR